MGVKGPKGVSSQSVEAFPLVMSGFAEAGRNKSGGENGVLRGRQNTRTR